MVAAAEVAVAPVKAVAWLVAAEVVANAVGVAVAAMEVAATFVAAVS